MENRTSPNPRARETPARFVIGQRVTVSTSEYPCTTGTVLFEAEPGLAWVELDNGDEGVFTAAQMIHFGSTNG